jgi:hypothetical protein
VSQPCKFKLGACVRDKRSGDWGYIKRLDLFEGGWTLMIGGGADGGQMSVPEMDLEPYDPAAPQTNVFVDKGMRVRAEWFDTKPVALAGAQMKLGATLRQVEGTVTHVWGDHPTKPTKVTVAIQPDEGDEVEIQQEHIRAVRTSEGWRIR